ncbi:mediator of RNA polymerase II transcription subunit 27-like [Lineus longissimus]|uniref:mediator of RNA polymerase II transcription subunit 27-like n=1 Tax=Lineus longissimus TaxID=88925 RepID=UPI002B4DEC47
MADLNDTLNQALRAVQQLRNAVTHVVETLAQGVEPSKADVEKDKNKVFLTNLQQSLLGVNKHFSELEKYSNAATPMGPTLTAANSYFITLDPVMDKTPLFTQLQQSYKWWNKAQEFAGHTMAILNQNLLKRSNQSGLMHGKRFRKSPSHMFPNQVVDLFIQNLDRLFPDMSVQLTRPMGNSAVLKITLETTFQAIVVLRGVIIESVVVKAYGEDSFCDNPKDEIWTKSRYQVFQKVTEHANVAMIHFFSPQMPDLALKSFMTWLHSYKTLFTSPCKKCGRYLQEGLPPSWRDNRSLEAYHEGCRQ